MKYLAIDYGLKRCGIAVSDAGGRMAFPRTTLLREQRDAFFTELLRCIGTEDPQAIVVGLPVHVDGAVCEMTRQVHNFVKSLQRRCNLPLFLMMETLSSFEAEEDLKHAGKTGKNTKSLIDQQAAVRILQSFLDLPEHERRPA